MKVNNIDHQNWSIDTLNKAYRQGYMFGLSGESRQQCPYQSDVIAAAWEAGWLDGSDQASVTQTLPLEEAAIA